jgi:hypothetical protein
VKPVTYFQRSIIEKGLIPQGVDARHVEGYVRLEYSFLGEMSWHAIRREVRIALGCIKEGGIAAAERNAQSFGL